MIHEHIALARLQRVEHFQEAGLFLCSSLGGTVVAHVVKMIMFHGGDAVDDGQVILLCQPVHQFHY